MQTYSPHCQKPKPCPVTYAREVQKARDAIACDDLQAMNWRAAWLPAEPPRPAGFANARRFGAIVVGLLAAILCAGWATVAIGDLIVWMVTK